MALRYITEATEAKAFSPVADGSGARLASTAGVPANAAVSTHASGSGPTAAALPALAVAAATVSQPLPVPAAAALAPAVLVEGEVPHDPIASAVTTAPDTVPASCNTKQKMNRQVLDGPDDPHERTSNVTPLPAPVKPEKKTHSKRRQVWFGY